MLTAGDGSAGGGCGSTGAPCCPGALSGSKWGVAESLSSYQGAGMKLAGGCEETTEALCRARGGGSAEDEDKPMGQAAGGSSCSSGQEAWTPSADHAFAGDIRGAADEARQESGVQVASSISAPRGGGGGCNAEETATKPISQEVGGGSGQEEAGALSSHRARAVGGDVRSSAASGGAPRGSDGCSAEETEPISQQEEEVGGGSNCKEAWAPMAHRALVAGGGDGRAAVWHAGSRRRRRESGTLEAGDGAVQQGSQRWVRRNNDDGFVGSQTVIRSHTWVTPVVSSINSEPVSINDDDGDDRCQRKHGARPEAVAAGGVKLDNICPAKRRMRSRSRENRRLLLWDMAREDVRIQCQNLDIRIVVHQPLLDVHTDEWLCRLGYLRKAARRRPIYIGTTSDPTWRFLGGPGLLREEGDDSHRTPLHPHCKDYKVMHVIASLPDHQCAEAETIAILDASRIPTSPSSNDAQANGSDQGSEGSYRVTKKGWGTRLTQDGEDGGGIGGG